MYGFYVVTRSDTYIFAEPSPWLGRKSTLTKMAVPVEILTYFLIPIPIRRHEERSYSEELLFSYDHVM